MTTAFPRPLGSGKAAHSHGRDASMSVFTFSRFSSSSLRLLVDLVGQVLVLVAAAAGVLIIAGGCGPTPQQLQQMQFRQAQEQQPAPMMRAALTAPPDSTLIESPVAGPAPVKQPAAGQPGTAAGSRAVNR